MAFGDPLPAEDHVTRGCSRGYDNDEVTASSFELRDQEKPLLRISVDWVECPGAHESERNPLGSANRMRLLPVNPPFARLAVSEIRQVNRASDEPDGEPYQLDAKEFGNTRHPCHCGITGYTGTHVDLELQDDLAVIANRSPVIW